MSSVPVSTKLSHLDSPPWEAHMTWYETVSHFMSAFKGDPSTTVKDLVNLYPNESVQLMDLLVKYTNTPAILR